MRILTRRDTGLLTQWTFGTSAIDPDAIAFIVAAAITDLTQEIEIVNVVSSLKSNNLWSKFNAIYPFVGGNATSHSYNLINTTQFQITWNGGVTHNSNGITGNGVNAYGNTNFSIVNFAQNNLSFGAYSRTNTINTGGFGAAELSTFNGCLMFIKNSDSKTYYSANNYILDGNANVVSDTRGLFVSNRLISNTSEFYRNGVPLISAASLSIAPANINFSLLARNISGTLQSFDTRNYAFHFMAQGLSSAEQSTLYTIVQNFQTTLGRQI
jgi:hypothetical protein